MHSRAHERVPKQYTILAFSYLYQITHHFRPAPSPLKIPPLTRSVEVSECRIHYSVIAKL